MWEVADGSVRLARSLGTGRPSGAAAELLGNLRQLRCASAKGDRSAERVVAGQSQHRADGAIERPASARDDAVRHAGANRSLSPSPLSTGSALASRANNRVVACFDALQEDAKLGGTVSACTSSPTSRKSAFIRETSLQLRQKEKDLEDSYREVFESIEAALNGRNSIGTTLLSPGQATDGSARMGNRCYYFVRLPRRHVLVNVCVTRVAGGAPALYASTTDVWPAADKNQFASKDGELSFHHHPNAEDAPVNDAGGVLYLCVESSATAGCDFRIRYTLRKPPALLHEDTQSESGDEGISDGIVAGGRAQKAKMRIDDVLETLRNDPVARSQFDERVRIAQRAKARESARGRRRFEAVHQHFVQELAAMPPRHYPVGVHKRTSERLDVVARRRQEIEKAKEDRAMWWVCKEEVRRQEKEAAAAYEVAAAARIERQELLFKLLATTGFFAVLLKHWWSQMATVRQMRKEVAACKVIQRFTMNSFTKKRRTQMYMNAIRLRLAATAYTRQMQLAASMVSFSRVNWFLNDVYSAARKDVVQSSSIALTIKRYIYKVKLVQRTWRRILQDRRERVQALMHRFRAEPLVKEVKQAALAALATVTAALAATAETTSQGQSSQPVSPARGGRQKPSQHSSVRGSLHASNDNSHSSAGRASKAIGSKRLKEGQAPRPTKDIVAAKGESTQEERVIAAFESERGATDGGGAATGWTSSLPAYVKHFNGEELMPEWLRRYILHEHVVQMQKSYLSRVQEWREQRAAAGITDDFLEWGLVQHSDVANTKWLKKRPLPLELSRIRGLYEESYEAYLRGTYKWLLHDRNRKTGKVFTAWKRLAQNIKMAMPVEGTVQQALGIRRRTRKLATMSTALNASSGL